MYVEDVSKGFVNVFFFLKKKLCLLTGMSGVFGLPTVETVCESRQKKLGLESWSPEFWA